jgi:uncharacterized membrane protein YsdA (DUF1294 family)/cold shock CspA family protein
MRGVSALGSNVVRYQGRITNWRDDKGFGFVTPNGGGPAVFVHIKSFSNRQRRPVGNELVTYELTSDARGRPQGVNVAFVGDRPYSYPTTAPGPGVGALTFAATFLAFVVWAAAAGRLPFVVLGAYLVASCVAYVSYMFDKAASLKGQWRTPESTLHLFSLVGGWPGAMLAQRTLRHKTQKPSFQVTYWATVVLNCAALGWLLSPSGMRTIKSFVGAA